MNVPPMPPGPRPVAFCIVKALEGAERRERLVMAVDFYVTMRVEFTERAARIMAELYLRRKWPSLDANQAAELLADALARRASL